MAALRCRYAYEGSIRRCGWSWAVVRAFEMCAIGVMVNPARVCSDRASNTGEIWGMAKTKERRETKGGLSAVPAVARATRRALSRRSPKRLQAGRCRWTTRPIRARRARHSRPCQIRFGVLELLRPRRPAAAVAGCTEISRLWRRCRNRSGDARLRRYACNRPIGPLKRKQRSAGLAFPPTHQ